MFTHLLTESRQRLAGQWGQAALFALVYYIIFGIPYGVLIATANNPEQRGLFKVSYILLLLVTYPLTYSIARASVNVWRGGKISASQVFLGFKAGAFVHSLLSMLWYGFVLCLWILPGAVIIILGVTVTAICEGDLIMAAVGGLITAVGAILYFVAAFWKGVQYCFVPYVMANEPDVPVTKTTARSAELIKGHWWFTVLLAILMLLISLLGLLCFGVGLLIAVPFDIVLFAGYYCTLAAPADGSSLTPLSDEDAQKVNGGSGSGSGSGEF